MARASAQIRINLPTEQVWQILGNPLKLEDYHPALYRVEYIYRDHPEPGARMHWFFRIGKREGYFEEELVVRDERRRIVFENRGGQNILPFKSARTSFEVEADGSGSQARVVVDFSLSGIARLFQGAVVKRYESHVLASIARRAQDTL